MLGSFSRLLLILGLFLQASLSLAQQKSPIYEIRQSYEAARQASEKRISRFLKRNPDFKKSFRYGKDIYALMDVNENGVPEYFKTNNADVALSLGVPAMRVGGSLGLNLLGTGMVLGTWDGGPVRTDHVELIGRVTQVDGSGGYSGHATHTSGTMIASGVSAQAKGMAPQATLKAYDFYNDVSEMTTVAKPDQTSMLLSNHSYGTNAGWGGSSLGVLVWYGDPTISTVEDYKFGFYDTQTAQWDAIAFSAPYYLIVKSAGNDRGEVGSGPNPPDGAPDGFDCIPTYGVAKNILTVGAVEKLGTYSLPSDVVMTTFSSWGPTDDGRIKPDIVAPGTNVYSSIATSTTAYSSASGTSMSTPAVTGSLSLLQQLYKNIHGNYMRSATLKAVALHTTREAGADPGPDYRFGWGLFDAEAAAGLILNEDEQNVFITEATLTAGQTFQMSLSPKAGAINPKITATLVWTDPAGTTPALAVDPQNKMLVNDLDLRLTDDANVQQLPWTLNPASPNSAASQGDNIRDNVEKIELNQPTANSYTLTVSHKGNLTGHAQAFSLILTYSSLSEPPSKLYWIGDGGDWNDQNHWSATSGGSPAGVIPGMNDLVQFDENSFSSGPAQITMSAGAVCHTFRWLAPEAVDLSMNGQTLTVDGGILMTANQLTTSTPGIIRLTGSFPSAYRVNLGGNILHQLTFQFGGPSVWELTGTASVHQLDIIQGTLHLNHADLRLNALSGSGNSNLDFTQSSLKTLDQLNINFSGLAVSSDIESSIIAWPGVNTLEAADVNFQGYVYLSNSNISIHGTQQVRSIQGKGNVTLSGSLLISYISLSGGSQLLLEEGSTQTFTDKFIFTGTPSNKVLIQSTGSGPAMLAFNDYYKICVDNVAVTNVSAIGTSVVNASTGSTLVNALNWRNTICSSILFPNFAVTYPCEKSAVYFTDKSSGPLTSRLWDFGDPGSSQNTSTLTNPVHYYEQPGNYAVTLTLEGTGGPLTASRSFTLQSNALPDNSVDLSGHTITSHLISTSYQWLRDGQIVSGATAKTYSYGVNGGEYSVLLFNATCNKRSDVFRVTEIEELSAIPLKIYPNPTSDILQFETHMTVAGVELIDAMGRAYPMEAETMDQGRYRLTLSQIPVGLYILRVSDGVSVESQKVVVRR